MRHCWRWTLHHRPLEARLTVRLKEGSGRPVERDITRRILPDAPVIGIKPAFAEGTVPEGAAAEFNLIAVGPDEKPAAPSPKAAAKAKPSEKAKPAKSPRNDDLLDLAATTPDDKD